MPTSCVTRELQTETRPRTPIGWTTVRTPTAPHAVRTWSQGRSPPPWGAAGAAAVGDGAVRRPRATANTRPTIPQSHCCFSPKGLEHLCHTDVCSSFIHNRPDQEAAETPLVHADNGTSLSDKNEPPSHKMTWGKRKRMPPERSQCEEATEGVTPTLRHLEKVGRQ